MEALKQSVEQLVDLEYNRASSKFGKTNHSRHESYAVLLEEYEEAMDEVVSIESEMPAYWLQIKRDSKSPYGMASLEHIADRAINAACEFIQVAAMAHKATLSEPKEDDK